MAKQEKVFDFKKSLKEGQKGESEFFELFKDKLIREDGYIQDFTIKKNGKKIEVKTDKYYNSGNFFIEQYSYKDVPGGPVQSLIKGIDYFIFYFPAIQSIHCFRTDKLVEWLKRNYEMPYLLNIRNRSHITRGYLVKREELKHLEINIEDIL